MAVTLKDIATQAGVSQAAVSIALGSSGRISDATRKRILGIAAELGYRPNLLVQGIQTGRTQTIGLLMHFATAFDAQLFEGIHNALNSRNYVPIVLCRDDRCRTDQGVVLEQVLSLLDRRVDGVLLRPTDGALWQDHLDEILERGVPVAALDTEIQAKVPQIDFYGTDDIHGAQVVAKHLLDLGHRRFGVATSGDLPTPMAMRSEAFVEAVAATPGTTCVIKTSDWIERQYNDRGAQALLDLDPRPTAIFATSDNMAITVTQAAEDRGLSIPQDFSVVGFSDTVNGNGPRPTLTTVRQDPFAIGHGATTLLLDRIDEQHNKTTPKSPRKAVRQKTELIIRETTGPPPGP